MRESVQVDVTPDLKGFREQVNKATQGYKVTVKADADVKAAVNRINSVQGKTVTINADADVKAALNRINSVQGKTVTINADADTTAARKKISALTGREKLNLVVEAVTSRRSEEHTSELQSRENLVCRLLLEK